MKDVGTLFYEFYKDVTARKDVIIYEQEKRLFPMVDFDAFLKSIPAKLRIPDVIASSFLARMPEFATLYWGYTINKKEENGGEFNLYHLLNALVSNTINKTSLKDYPGIASPKLIDSHPHTGDGVQVLFDAGKWPDWQHAGLLISNENGKIHELTINYEEYVNFTYVSKGFYNWQYLFMKDKSSLADSKKQLMATYFSPMRQVLPTLFPSVNYSALFKAIDQF